MKKLFSLLIIIFFSSCQGEKNEEALQIIKASLNEVNISISDLFESARVVPLETTDNSLIMSLKKIIYYNNQLYIFDDKLSGVFIFDKNGKFINKIVRVGQGEGEYTLIYDFVINEAENQIEMLSPFGAIYCYDLEGAFLKKYNLPSPPPNYQRMEFLDAKHIITWSHVTSDENGLSILSRTTNSTINSFWKNDMIMNMLTNNVFYKYNDDLYFNICLSGKIYKITLGGYALAYEWNLGKDDLNIGKYKLVSRKDIATNEDINRLRRLLEKGEMPFYFFKQGQTDRYYYTQLFFNLKTMKNLFYDKKTGKSFFFEKTKEGIGIDPLLISNDYLISEIKQSDIQYLANSKIITKEDRKKLIVHNREEENPILVLYK